MAGMGLPDGGWSSTGGGRKGEICPNLGMYAFDRAESISVFLRSFARTSISAPFLSGACGRAEAVGDRASRETRTCGSGEGNMGRGWTGGGKEERMTEEEQGVSEESYAREGARVLYLDWGLERTERRIGRGRVT
ncbi:hypothetical protein GY45DRAFT_123978 [Cubamyces sp. BRFM 1775]|nr:hypothetical protein GY45DRAFT_123978 [Cubamyces sp. BRFM 1775]